MRNDTPNQITEKLIQLRKYVKSVSPDTKVVLSNIIRRYDYQKEHLSKKMDNNTLFPVKCRRHKIDLIDNINVTGMGKTGVHPNNLGKE